MCALTPRPVMCLPRWAVWISGGIHYNRPSWPDASRGRPFKPFHLRRCPGKGDYRGQPVNDSPVTYDRGTGQPGGPEITANETHGELSLSQALAYSNNVIAVKLLDTIGVPYFTEFTSRFGLSPMLKKAFPGPGKRMRSLCLNW